MTIFVWDSIGILTLNFIEYGKCCALNTWKLFFHNFLMALFVVFASENICTYTTTSSTIWSIRNRPTSRRPYLPPISLVFIASFASWKRTFAIPNKSVFENKENCLIWKKKTYTYFLIRGNSIWNMFFTGFIDQFVLNFNGKSKGKDNGSSILIFL